MPDMTALLDKEAIVLSARAADQQQAIRTCGQLLVDVGAVSPDYIEAMLARERSVSTYLGEGVAIPHGTAAAKEAVRRDALAVVRFDEPVAWGTDTAPVTMCIAIAARGDGHIGILTELAQILMDADASRALREATTPDDVLALLQPGDQGDS